MNEIRIVEIDCRDEHLQAEYGAWFWINDLFIATPHRRRGIASALIEYILRRFESDSVLRMDGMCCGIFATNQPSCQLFESMGFRYVFDYARDLRLYSRTKPDHRPEAIVPPSRAEVAP